MCTTHALCIPFRLPPYTRTIHAYLTTVHKGSLTVSDLARNHIEGRLRSRSELVYGDKLVTQCMPVTCLIPKVNNTDILHRGYNIRLQDERTYCLVIGSTATEREVLVFYFQVG